MQEVRGRGKEDKRAGGEDLMVLGVHNFDLLRRFAGDPLWAFGRVTVNGGDIQRKDVVMDGPEGLGPVGGDAIEGTFGFANGLTGYFASKKSSDVSGKRWGFDLYGTKGVIAIRLNHVPDIFISATPIWTDAAWNRFPLPEGIRPRSVEDAYHLMIDDMLEAIEKDREPVASGRQALWSVEMAMSLYASQRSGGRIALPLKQREHPLLV